MNQQSGSSLQTPESLKQNPMSDNRAQFLVGIAIIFWGYSSNLLAFAIPMALMTEARFYFNRRWALEKLDFYRIADLTSIGLLAMMLFLFLNRQEYHFITTMLSWLPILLFPLVTVLAFSTTARMPLDVLFYSLRRQREPVQQSWDMSYVLLGACLLAAGLNRDNPFYFAMVALIVCLALYRLRSHRFNKQVFVLVMTTVLVAATVLHFGIRSAHLGLKAQTERWIANWISQRTDPLKTRTAIGQVGRLKLSDAISFRIEPVSGEADFPPRLIEAIYNAPAGFDWEVFDPRFDTVPAADDFKWWFTDEPETPPQAKIYLEFDREHALVPVPAEVTEIYELAATEIGQSTYGSIQAKGLIPAPHYRVRYDRPHHLGDAPTKTDLFVPPEYREMLAQILPEDDPAQAATTSPEKVVKRVQDFFGGFSYSLYQHGTAVRENPMKHFLTNSQRGHCEYFASSTALMLRHLGIPSRYVVGYSVQEWNESMGLYIVRERHAHAWAIAYIDDKWITVDTTPGTWFGMENDAAGLFQPLWDFVGNNIFRLQRWWQLQKLEDYEKELYFLGGILALILGYRIYRSDQVILDNPDDQAIAAMILPGADSPFFKIESQLERLGYKRGRGELMRQWLIRIKRPELLPLLAQHNRLRFDPEGASQDLKRQLASEVAGWLNRQENQPAAAEVPNSSSQ